MAEWTKLSTTVWTRIYLIDGKHKKTLFVKTLNGKTANIKYDPLDTVESVKEQIERKTRIPKEQPHLVSQGKVLKDKLEIEDYNVKAEDTIELTAALVGGRKEKQKEKHQNQTLKSVVHKKAEVHQRTLKKNGTNDAEDGRNIEVGIIPNGRHFFNRTYNGMDERHNEHQLRKDVRGIRADEKEKSRSRQED